MLWAWVGLIWLWFKFKGRKSFLQLKKENPNYEQSGVDILWNILLGFFLVAIIASVGFAIYTFANK